MTLIIENQTSGTLSYLGGLVTVAANSNTTVPSQYLYPISRDPGLLNDSLQANVNLSDNVQTYLTVQAANYLNTIATSIGGAVVGLVGSSAPSYAIIVGGKDPSGNTIIGTFDSNGNLKTLDYSTSPTGSTIPSDSCYIGGKNPTGNLQGITTDSSGKMYVDLFDGSGNSLASINNQLETRDVINVSSQYRAQSITTAAAEALGAATILVNRKLLHITPTNGIIYWGYNNTVTTTTGTPIFPNNTLWLSVTDNIHVFLIASTTTDSRIGELS